MQRNPARETKNWKPTILGVVKNDMKELGLASVDAVDRHAWERKIMGDMC